MNDVGWWNEPCRGCPSAEESLSRYSKKASNFLGLLQLACGLLWYRRGALLF